MVLVLALCLVVATYILNYLWIHRRILAISNKLYGPKPWPIIGNGHLFIGSSEKVFNTIKKLVTEYPRPTRLWLGPRLFVVLDHPDDVQCVVNSQNALYKDKVYKFLECFGGPGMITINGNMWKTHRKVLNPCFNMKILESYMPIFNKGSRTLIENLEKHAGGDTFNIESYFHACTLDLVIETTMGVPFNIQKNENMEFLNASDMVLHIVTYRITKAWLHPDIIFKLTKNYQIQTNNCKIIRKFIHEVLEKTKSELERDKSNADEATNADGDYECPQIYVNQMLKLSKADGNDQSFTDDEVIAEAITAIAAGNETSGLAIANTILLLAIFPEIQEKVFQELHDVLPSQDCEITAEDLNKLVYLEWTLKESMRLYPLAPILLRYCTGDVQVGDLTLPKGCSICFSVLTMHRRKDVWGEDADNFNPEHFNPEQHSKRNPACFMPFGGGYRMCIGWKYAMMMMKTILVYSLRQYKFTTDLKESEFRFQIDITMRLINKHLVKAERRKW